MMPDTLPRPDRAGWRAHWMAALLITLTWLLVVVAAIVRLRQEDGLIVALAALVASAMTLTITARADRARWRIPIENLTRFVRDFSRDHRASPTPSHEPELMELTLEVCELGFPKNSSVIGRPKGGQRVSVCLNLRRTRDRCRQTHS